MPTARRTVEDIRDAVRGGASLSTALERQHGTFNRLFVNMVRAGSAAGSPACPASRRKAATA